MECSSTDLRSIEYHSTERNSTVGHSIECGSVEHSSIELCTAKIVYVWYVILPIPHLDRIEYYPNR